MIATTLGFLLPASDSPSFSLFRHSDKVIHILIFAVSSYLLCLNISKSRLAMKVFAIGAIYGLIIECFQIYVPGRSFEWWDLISDMVGAVLGYLVFHYISHRKEFNS